MPATFVNWGSYDIDNFGDLLFPFIVARHLRPYGARILHASPTGRMPMWPDVMPTLTIAQALELTGGGSQLTGLIVGGGNLVSFTSSSARNYSTEPVLSDVVHRSFCWVPYVLRAKYGVPYSFNYVGVSKEIPAEWRCVCRTTIEPAAFVSCREAEGERRLRRCGVRNPITVGCDSAIGVCEVFPAAALQDEFEHRVRALYRIPVARRLAVLHLKRRYLDGALDAVATIIGLLTSQGVHPVLLPLGACHGDDDLLEDVRDALRGATLIPRPERLLDMLAILAASSCYLGSSLHGAIAALSYGLRVAVVADEARTGFRKFSGFLEQVGLSEAHHASWPAALHVLAQNGLSALPSMPDHARVPLAQEAEHWRDLVSALVGADRGRFCPEPSVAAAVAAHHGI